MNYHNPPKACWSKVLVDDASALDHDPHAREEDIVEFPGGNGNETTHHIEWYILVGR